ncbi:MAG: four helix bundle protein [Akkermansiaceae bacterium]|mgnify:CR=1 FL=1|jgi:four helix bundle protein|nr:four helix bundle protein [Akkermansiaceae bacterium]
MSEQSEAMKERTRQFSYRVGNLVLHMGRTTLLAEVYGKQLLRCASSVGANYRAACRAKSDRDFLNKIKICEEESDECLYWLDHIGHFELIKPASRLEPLYQEAREICAIVTATAKTIRTRLHE